MKKTPLLLATALLFVLGACDNPLADPGADAAAAFEKQDYFATRDAALAALRDNGEDAAALELLARAQLAVGEGQNALASLERLDKLETKPADITLLKAEAQLQVGDADAMAALIDGDESAEAWRLRALAASLAGDQQAAMGAFRQGRTAAGDKLKLYTAEASYFLALGDRDAARAAVGLAQQAGPTRLETLFVTAKLAQLEGNAEIASRAFLAILKIAPYDRPAMLGAIAEMGNMGRIDLLRPLVMRGREAFPGDAEFAFLEARLKAQDGDWQGARDMLQARESELGSHPESRGLYAEALVRLGQVELARTHITPLYRAMPGNPQIARVYARVLLESGNAAEARQIIGPLAAQPNALAEDVELAARASQG